MGGGLYGSEMISQSSGIVSQDNGEQSLNGDSAVCVAKEKGVEEAVDGRIKVGSIGDKGEGEGAGETVNAGEEDKMCVGV
jgi:hypothetical protein